MHQAKSNPDCPKVLHIQSVPPEDQAISRQVSEFDALLAESRLRVEACEDVYRGLARLCRPDADPPLLAFVCIDVLGPDEFEFFSLARRAQRGVPVYVYGAQPSRSLITKAIQLGATGEATTETLHAFVGGPSAPQAAPAPCDGPVSAALSESARKTAEVSSEVAPPGKQKPSGSETQTGGAPSEPRANRQDDGRPTSEGADPSADQPEVPSRARVPWLHYADRPKRAGPPGREPPASGLHAPEDRPTRPASHEPLLTEAELKALLADDIAAIAPSGEDDQADRDDTREGDEP